MEIAVISDLHLGTGDAADGFGHDDGEFLKFLSFLEKNFQKVVLLGDIWETLTGALPGDPKQELQRARQSHPEIAARFERPNYLYVHGNHDIIAGAHGVPDELVVHTGGSRILFTHGHQNDDLVQKRRWLSELGVWLGGWIRRLGLGALYRLLNELDEMRGGLSTDSTLCSFQKWAMGIAAQREFDVIVTGHTHLAANATHGSRLFLNSGSCSEGKLSFLSMNTVRGNYAVNTSY
jgi:predicted phosphodiesterase